MSDAVILNKISQITKPANDGFLMYALTDIKTVQFPRLDHLPLA